MESAFVNVLGLVLNFVGTILVAMSFGQNPENANSTDAKGRPVFLASFLHPSWFRYGLVLFSIGFLLQLLSTAPRYSIAGNYKLDRLTGKTWYLFSSAEIPVKLMEKEKKE